MTVELKDANGNEFKTFDVTGGDFPELEGKIVMYKQTYGEPEPVLVVGCNRAVGCTLVNPADKDDYYACIVGPAAPGFDYSDWEENYDAMFDELVESIFEGLIVVDDVFVANSPFFSMGGSPNGSSCAFGQ